MTSAADPTSSLIAISASAAAGLIASLFVMSIGCASCSVAIPSHHRNISTAHLFPIRMSNPSSFEGKPGVVHWKRKVRAVDDSSQSSKLKNLQKLACHSCTYIQQKDYSTGAECNDPFNADQIPEVMCTGSCSKLKQTIATGEMLVRGCLPKCREKVDEHGYTLCCQSKLCNRSTSLNSIRHAFTVLCSTLFSLFLVTRLNDFV